MPGRPPSTARLAILAPRRDLPTLMSGGPLLLVEHLLPDTTVLLGSGAVVARLQVLADRAVIHIGTEVKDPVPLDHPPAGLLALIGRSSAGLQRVVAAWRDHPIPQPALIQAESAIAALPELLRMLMQENREAMRRAAALDARLAALRTEADEGRAAMAELLAAMGGRSPPAPETVFDAQPGGETLRLEAGAPPLVFEPGIVSTGVAVLALHLAAPAGAELRVRLIGAEAARALAAWTVPAAALAEAGWLVLETPMPLAGPPQTLALECAATGGAGEVLLSAGPGAEEIACRIATLPPGARAVHPLHVDWAGWEADAPAPPERRLAPFAMLAGMTLDGPGILQPVEVTGRTLELSAGWGQAALRLGPLPRGLQAVQIELRLSEGALEAELLREADGAGTGWREVRGGEARTFALDLPAGEEAVLLRLRGGSACRVTLGRPVLYARRLGVAAPVPPPAAAPAAPPRIRVAPRIEPPRPAASPPPPPPVVPPPPVAGRGGTRHDGVVLDAHQSGEGWALLDLRIEGLIRGREAWREVKVKFGLSGPDVALEFRRRPDLPRMFETWPGQESDAYGDKFHIVLGGKGDIWGLDRVAEGRDSALIAGLAEILEGAVRRVAPAEAAARFVPAAARMAAALLARGS